MDGFTIEVDGHPATVLRIFNAVVDEMSTVYEEEQGEIVFGGPGASPVGFIPSVLSFRATVHVRKAA